MVKNKNVAPNLREEKDSKKANKEKKRYEQKIEERVCKKRNETSGSLTGFFFCRREMKRLVLVSFCCSFLDNERVRGLSLRHRFRAFLFFHPPGSLSPSISLSFVESKKD